MDTRRPVAAAGSGGLPAGLPSWLCCPSQPDGEPAPELVSEPPGEAELRLPLPSGLAGSTLERKLDLRVPGQCPLSGDSPCSSSTSLQALTRLCLRGSQRDIPVPVPIPAVPTMPGGASSLLEDAGGLCLRCCPEPPMAEEEEGGGGGEAEGRGGIAELLVGWQGMAWSSAWPAGLCGWPARVLWILLRPRWAISRMLRKRETAAMLCMKSMKMVFSVGRDTKQSTVLGQGGRVHL